MRCKKNIRKKKKLKPLMYIYKKKIKKMKENGRPEFIEHFHKANRKKKIK